MDFNRAVAWARLIESRTKAITVFCIQRISEREWIVACKVPWDRFPVSVTDEAMLDRLIARAGEVVSPVKVVEKKAEAASGYLF